MIKGITINGTTYPPPTYETCHDGITQLCPAELSLYGGTFTLGACIFFVTAHALALLPQLYFGIRAKTWSYTVWLMIGTLFELIGYSGRIVMSSNPWVYNAFVIQLVLLILGPTLVAAAISITFKHLVLWYGREYSFIKPVLYPWVFVGLDLFSIVIQAAGGGISSAATSGDKTDQGMLDVGKGLLVAGVVFQLVNMVICGGLMMVYVWRRHKAIKNGAAVRAGDGTATDSVSSGRGPKIIRASDKKTKIFVLALSVAYIAIIIRCIYRIPEMSMGWGSKLMKDETLFLILDGAMILIAVWTLTIFHPYFFFPYMGKNHKDEMNAERYEGQRESGHAMEETGARK